eukprot:10288015-Alexandrium_andersonii.AAC.1
MVQALAKSIRHPNGFLPDWRASHPRGRDLQGPRTRGRLLREPPAACEGTDAREAAKGLPRGP